ncbi:MAG: DUF3817 domain-containing protein [Mycobacteriales bacterium]
MANTHEADTELFSPQTSLKWFRIAAIAEGCSWAALLIGMFFKYIVVHNEIGVKIFGPIHGCLFIAYVVLVVLAARANAWKPKRLILGIAASVPPLFTIWFERSVMRSVDVSVNSAEAHLSGSETAELSNSSTISADAAH